MNKLYGCIHGLKPASLGKLVTNKQSFAIAYREKDIVTTGFLYQFKIIAVDYCHINGRGMYLYIKFYLNYIISQEMLF